MVEHRRRRSSSTLRVKASNETNFNKVTMDAQLVGEVELHFQTQTFPAITS